MMRLRSIAAHAFGRCVVLHKATYFDDQYLKYFGWMCNDSSPLVRAASIQQLVAIYKAAKDDLEPLENFTGRFVDRFLELAKDIDGRVTTEALKLIHLLLSLNILPDSEEVVKITLPLMHTGDTALLKALAPLIQHRLQHATDDEGTVSQTTAKAKKKGRSKAADGGAQVDAEQTPQQSLLRLAKLLQAEAGDAGGDARGTRLELCSNVVGAMHDEPSLSNWAAYCDLLLNAEDEDEDVQVMLLHLMGAAASAAAASSGEAEADLDTQVTRPAAPPSNFRRSQLRSFCARRRSPRGNGSGAMARRTRRRRTRATCSCLRSWARASPSFSLGLGPTVSPSMPS